MGNELRVVNDQGQPTKPFLKPRLRSLLDSASETRDLTDGPTITIIDRYWEPPLVSPEGKSRITTLLAEYDHYLEPAPREKILARVTVLLGHFFVPDLPVAAQTALLVDWVEVLAEFPWWAIEEASREWLKSQTRKPTPGDIAKLCRAAVSASRVDMWALRRMLEARPDEDAPAQRAN